MCSDSSSQCVLVTTMCKNVDLLKICDVCTYVMAICDVVAVSRMHMFCLCEHVENCKINEIEERRVGKECRL